MLRKALEKRNSIKCRKVLNYKDLKLRVRGPCPPLENTLISCFMLRIVNSSSYLVEISSKEHLTSSARIVGSWKCGGVTLTAADSSPPAKTPAGGEAASLCRRRGVF